MGYQVTLKEVASDPHKFVPLMVMVFKPRESCNGISNKLLFMVKFEIWAPLCNKVNSLRFIKPVAFTFIVMPLVLTVVPDVDGLINCNCGTIQLL